MADKNKTIESLALEADGMGTDTPADATTPDAPKGGE